MNVEFLEATNGDVLKECKIGSVGNIAGVKVEIKGVTYEILTCTLYDKKKMNGDIAYFDLSMKCYVRRLF
tara:strand:+ start:824 stop:1033 length:210 start_codon:yes stop_codon:yes gene_type:complete